VNETKQIEIVCKNVGWNKQFEEILETKVFTLKLDSDDFDKICEILKTLMEIGNINSVNIKFNWNEKFIEFSNI